MLDEKQRRFLDRAKADSLQTAAVGDGEHMVVGDLLFRGLVEPAGMHPFRFRITRKGEIALEVASA